MKNLLLTILILLFIVACKPDASQAENVETKNENPEVSKIDKTPKFCTKDLKVCPDGNSVTRNPDNNCEFDPCPVEKVKAPYKKEPMICPADVKECPDGSYVSRDHNNNCKFKECPNTGSKKDKI